MFAIVVLLLARLPSIPVRFFDPDELEHAHAAWSMSKGLLPYRDFFEHHTPWYHLLLASFFRWFAAEQSFDGAMRFLDFGRTLSLVLTALSAAMIFFVGRSGANRRAGLLAALFFLGQPVIIQKSLEIRPDVLALPFFIGGLWLLLRGLDEEAAARTQLLRFLAGGLCLGAAIMCTQKMVFVLPGAVAGLALWVQGGGRRKLPVRCLAVLVLGAGVALPGILTWGAFALHGGGRQFIFENFLLNARWKARVNRHLLTTVETSAPIVALGLLGALLALRKFWRERPRVYGDVFLLCTMAGLIAGIRVIPIAYRQYFLMPLTIVCLFAARGLCFLVDLAKERTRARVAVLATIPLLILPGIELATSATDHDALQTARLRYVFEHTSPGDRVLDGWLGTAVFRPSPGYYLFMHSEVLAMLSEEQRAAYLDVLESGPARPALIVLDEDLKALGPRFLSFVRQHYVTDDGLFYRIAAAREP
ncbi:MAG TPA: glycosyltransferase family 39 protein [Polyangia bacterium]